ncbi:hypothetical protein K474DRAFT_1599954 [Panus rudis PR-1116 ss-1]|nr:hypothetical protein K474DRAFT_1599954 [Panus rudis PR-1116 ss-1]
MFFPSSPPRTLHRGRLHPGKLHEPNGGGGGEAAGSSGVGVGAGVSGVGVGVNANAMINEKNQLDLAKIESGGDTRTTVMIKNIPNKMSDQDLLRFIYKVCPRKIDFLYLRMDFQNGCNVGYAFVNFITVQDLLHFAKTCLNVRWNMYSSEKQLQMSYANYQGKEALVEKFKNSCIMDERESWRPKIFYSSGPHQGEPEPFPKPTHLRRKERSAHNRGALFVPSLGSQMLHHQHQHNQHQQYREFGRDQHQHYQQQQQREYREQERFGGGGRKGRDVGRGAEGGDGCAYRFNRA